MTDTCQDVSFSIPLRKFVFKQVLFLLFILKNRQLSHLQAVVDVFCRRRFFFADGDRLDSGSELAKIDDLASNLATVCFIDGHVHLSERTTTNQPICNSVVLAENLAQDQLSCVHSPDRVPSSHSPGLDRSCICLQRCYAQSEAVWKSSTEGYRLD